MSNKRFVVFAGLFAAAFVMVDGAAFAQTGEGASVYAASWGWGLVAAAYFLGLAAAAIGSAAGLGRAVSAALEGTARQPEAANDIRTSMIIGCALIEALAIYMLISPIIASLFLSGMLQPAAS
jgi:F-type H+-transporting ATPase subunit c